MLPNNQELLELMKPYFEELYSSPRIFPAELTALPELPFAGKPNAEIALLWGNFLRSSTHLMSPDQFGHMDTFVHPVAAVTDALVSALNNNPLWRELSPYASAVEEFLIEDFRFRLGLDASAQGIFCSGGSLANLSCFFAACGGFEQPVERENVWLICSEGAHASVKKSAAVLGIPKAQQLLVPCDSAGRMDVSQLRTLLQKFSLPGRRVLVNAVLGSTFHGAIDPLHEIADCCAEHGAWLHVDGVYGANLIFSEKYQHLISGIERADSLSFAPQKWMFVPRLCGMAYIRNNESFQKGLRWPMVYSASGAHSRGQWGIQGSRRADAVTLYMTLQALGTQQLASWIDSSIDHTLEFNRFLQHSDLFTPTHSPEMNLQIFHLGDGSKNRAFQSTLTASNGAWVSLGNWRNQDVLRAVLLHPETKAEQFQALAKRAETFLSRA